MNFLFLFGAEPCGLWGLSPQPGVEPGPSAVKAWSPSHWTTREFPLFVVVVVPLGLCCCTQAFSSCNEAGLLWLWCAGCSLEWLLCCGEQALGHLGSVVVAHGFNCSSVCGIFPDWGLNLCLLNWLVDNYWTTKEVCPVYFTKGPLNQFESVLVTVLGDSLFIFMMRGQRLLVEIKSEVHGPWEECPACSI